jgi:hypothetical protein
MRAMTKRERVMRTINFQETDRIPIYDIIDNDYIREYFGGGRITEENAWEFEYAAVRNALDMTRMLVVPNFHAGVDVKNEDGFVFHHDKYTVWIAGRPFDDMKGLLKWIEKDIDRQKKWNPDKDYVDNYRRYVNRHKKGIGDDTVIVIESDVGLDYCMNMAGMELFSYLIMDEPEITGEWLEIRNEAEIRRAKAIADPELVPVMLTYTDIAFKSGTVFSIDFLRKEFFPRLKKLNNAYQEAGVKCLFHSDGNLMPVMDDLVEADIDGINPVETMAGMSIGKIRKQYGKKIFITGGIDVSQLMVYGTPEEVSAECIKAIEESGGTGYFLGSTTELHPTVKVENLLAMINAAKHKPI